ncbi:ATP dependent RNA helicase and U5 mRNA splicing factor [Scheffersomyces xylosifermentans]|uniref:ATP dependent RNA helicase and U5 mRNA splicing factor n=1 Tax=Scheffersomyces xylosifermentans TaxID=1304137 RepID=UPI00315DDCCB
MDEDIYDEFGNLIGDPLDSDAESSDKNDYLVDKLELSVSDDDESEDEDVEALENSTCKDLVKGTSSGTFGQDVKQIFVKPYEQPEDTPVIQPRVEKKMKVDFTDSIDVDPDFKGSKEENLIKNLPELIYSRDYMIATMNRLPERIRNIALVGNLHSGKTAFIDSLVLHTHSPSIALKTSLKNFEPLRYMDNHKLEIDRGMTIKTSPITLLLQDLRDRSHVFNIFDTPGHPNFADETTAALQSVDGVVVVLDIVEGVTARDRCIIDEAVKDDLPIVILLNKIDRLILELQLPVKDAYHKLKYIVDHVTQLISNSEYISTYSHPTTISPIHNNVVFASSTFEFSFTLSSFAKLYLEKSGNQTIELETFSKKLWGDFFFDISKNKFTTDSQGGKLARSFVSFILEPIYKIVTYTLVAEPGDEKLPRLLWNNFGVTLKKQQYKQDAQILLKDVFKTIFGDSKGFVDSVTRAIDSPGNSKIINKEVFSDAILVARVLKLVESADANKFYTLVRVYKGTIKIGSRLKVLGENFNEDNENYRIEVVDELYIPGGRYKVPVDQVGKGSIAIIGGIDSTISKGATILSENQPLEHIQALSIPSYGNKSVFKVAVEPANPSELPKLLEGLRKVNKAYLAAVINVEESGEHVVLAPGELYLDCLLHDLRLFFTDDLEIKISDPMTRLSETVIDESAIKIKTSTPSQNNSISIISEPINDSRLSRAIESGKINLSQPLKTTAKILKKEFGWDALAARSVWCFGPDELQSPSILLDDTLEEETDKKLLYSVKDSISQGFKWSVNEGPLCDEPIRNTKFKILDAVISASEIQRSGTQIIPMTRRACYTGFLTASPRLMEPVYTLTAVCTQRAMPVIQKLVEARRGKLHMDTPIPATQLFELEGTIPVIESVGLETDIRIQTQGQAMCFFTFNSWEIVPGDPLDQDCYLPPLKPVPQDSLARDFVMKTRRRKGLTGEPSLQKYIDTDLYSTLKEKGIMK